jgi:phenylalanyl-tRNA synthetase beta chain
LTKERLLQALDAAIKMYQQLGGKLTAITITGNFEDIVEVVKLRHQKLNSLVGIDIEADFATSSLKKLHFAVKSIGEEWETVAPYWRLDIAVEEDLIEEVTRMYGYEKIPAKLLPGEPPAKINQALFDFSYNLKLALVEVGFSEIQTYSFYSTEVLNNLNIDKNNLIKIANPMSKETEYMRDHLWPNLLRATAENLKYRDEVTLFEIGKIYQPQVKDYPVERYHLSVALATSDDNAIQQLFQAVSQALLGLKADIDLGSTQMEKEESELFHPVRFAKITHETREAGTVAEVHPRITNKFGVNKRVAILEVELEPLTPAADDVASD